MRNQIRPLLSLVAIGLFLLLALASLDFGPDKSTNTTVAIKDCEEKPAVNVTLRIDVSYQWTGGLDDLKFIPGAFGNISIVHQKVNADKTCTFYVESSQVIDFVCNDDGVFTYEGPTWTHDNSEDLIRVELFGKENLIDFYPDHRKVKVLKYDNANFDFAIFIDGTDDL